MRVSAQGGYKCFRVPHGAAQPLISHAVLLKVVFRVTWVDNV